MKKPSGKSSESTPVPSPERRATPLHPSRMLSPSEIESLRKESLNFYNPVILSPSSKAAQLGLKKVGG